MKNQNEDNRLEDILQMKYEQEFVLFAETRYISDGKKHRKKKLIAVYEQNVPQLKFLGEISTLKKKYGARICPEFSSWSLYHQIEDVKWWLKHGEDVVKRYPNSDVVKMNPNDPRYIFNPDSIYMYFDLCKSIAEIIGKELKNKLGLKNNLKNRLLYFERKKTHIREPSGIFYKFSGEPSEYIIRRKIVAQPFLSYYYDGKCPCSLEIVEGLSGPVYKAESSDLAYDYKNKEVSGIFTLTRISEYAKLPDKFNIDLKLNKVDLKLNKGTINVNANCPETNLLKRLERLFDESS